MRPKLQGERAPARGRVLALRSPRALGDACHEMSMEWDWCESASVGVRITGVPCEKATVTDLSLSSRRENPKSHS